MYILSQTNIIMASQEVHTQDFVQSYFEHLKCCLSLWSIPVEVNTCHICCTVYGYILYLLFSVKAHYALLQLNDYNPFSHWLPSTHFTTLLIHVTVVCLHKESGHRKVTTWSCQHQWGRTTLRIEWDMVNTVHSQQLEQHNQCWCVVA